MLGASGYYTATTIMRSPRHRRCRLVVVFVFFLQTLGWFAFYFEENQTGITLLLFPYGCGSGPFSLGRFCIPHVLTPLPPACIPTPKLPLPLLPQ
jgi:hypothetical protein